MAPRSVSSPRAQGFPLTCNQGCNPPSPELWPQAATGKARGLGGDRRSPGSGGLPVSLPRKWVSENRKAAQGTHPSMDGGGVELSGSLGRRRLLSGSVWP